MAMGMTWLAAGTLGGLARSAGSPGFLGPLLGIVFLVLVLVAARIWLNRPDKL